MTREEIMRLEGRELDWLVHKRVFGYSTEWHEAENPSQGSGLCTYCVPLYSSDIAAAWQVVERMAERGYDMEISAISVVAGHADEPYIELAFGRTRTDLVRNRYAYTGPVPMAVCKAALLAVCGEAGGDG